MDVAVTRIDLPSPVLAAASDGASVWCAGSGGVAVPVPGRQADLREGVAARRTGQLELVDAPA
ncbi:hypothetical protein, partial [Nonomuraea sp. NPDC049695]|uniref:hypothetical protein n=1 Tax=Nonomuraea sp. NPDC049695 TaxID=3154734 RepID=UPI00343A20AD